MTITERVKRSFGTEWTTYYPTHGHDPSEYAREREQFLDYTRTVESDWRDKDVLDAGCGNGRYTKLVADWGAGFVLAVDSSDSILVAEINLRPYRNVSLIPTDFMSLAPYRSFDMVYSVGVLHHTPNAARSLDHLKEFLIRGGTLHIFVHAQGNRVLYAMNRLIRSVTSRAPHRLVWYFSLCLTYFARVLLAIPLFGPMLFLILRQIVFFGPDQHNNFDHYSAGYTSFHTKAEVQSWFDGWEDVIVSVRGIANESIYARGRKP